MVLAVIQHGRKARVACQFRLCRRHRAGWLRLVACVALAAAAYAAQAGNSPKAPPPPLAYETSAYELAAHLQRELQPWRASDLKKTILRRVAREKQRREMDVYYYRIGYTMSYPLPLAGRPGLKELPSAVCRDAPTRG